MKQLQVHQRSSIAKRVYLATLAICDEYSDLGYLSDEESSLIAFQAKRAARQVLLVIKDQRKQGRCDTVTTGSAT